MSNSDSRTVLSRENARHLADGELARLHIKAMVAPAQGDHHPFAGVMTGQNGEYIALVDGQIVAPEWLKAKPAARRGRPKNEPRKVGIHLHRLMACQCDEPSSVRKARLIVARALSIGGAREEHQADAERSVRRLECSVKNLLTDYTRLLICAGAKTGSARLGMLLRNDAEVSWDSGKLKMRGMAWLCRWGDKQATHARIDALLSDANWSPDIAQIVGE